MSPQRKRTRKPRIDGVEARARILDSAEQLFAERGFYGTSVRDITEHAGERLASVNYHFVSKESLFRDVLLRRAEALARDRFALLAQGECKGSVRARTRQLVHAFVTPVALRAAESQGWRNYLTLIAQVANSRIEALELVAAAFNKLALRFIKQLAGIFPGASSRALHHSYQSMLAATLYAFSSNRRLESLTRGALRSDDFELIAEDLIAFLTPAIVEACGKGRAQV